MNICSSSLWRDRNTGNYERWM